jgi:hypothetical protein
VERAGAPPPPAPPRTCNELGAGYAADGYARRKGVAAVVVTFCVGESPGAARGGRPAARGVGGGGVRTSRVGGWLGRRAAIGWQQGLAPGRHPPPPPCFLLNPPPPGGLSAINACAGAYSEDLVGGGWGWVWG